MPTYVKGNLWDEIGKADLICFTGNSTLNKHGHLIMGKGSALEAKQFFPSLPVLLGSKIVKRNQTYGLLIVDAVDSTGFPQRVGALQTKLHWSAIADPLLIAYSVGMLCRILDIDREKTYRSIAMPFPGIGYGNLQREQILPILEPLPERVKIYEPL